MTTTVFLCVYYIYMLWHCHNVKVAPNRSNQHPLRAHSMHACGGIIRIAVLEPSGP